MRFRPAAVALAIAFLLPGSSLGSVAGDRDPDDTRGPLDIRRIVHGHTDDGQLWHKVIMWKRWGAKDLAGQDEIRFEFSNDREDRYDEVNASVALKDGELRAWVFPYTEGSDYAGVGPSTRIRLARPNRYTVTIFFGKKWVDGRGRYVWSVGSSYKDPDSDNCRRYCSDRTDRFEHNL